jgi:hypothetical protein
MKLRCQVSTVAELIAASELINKFAASFFEGTVSIIKITKIVLEILSNLS